jgi:uncharacterized protein (DUF2062 family)
MKRWIPTREELRQMRWLHPIAHHFDNEHLWRMDRGSVARAVAIGLFFGLLIPVAQFLFAIATAIALRAHIAIAAAATLITNPFTFPPIYWAAFEFGRLVLGRPADEARAAQIESGTAAAVAQGADVGMFERMLSVVLGAGAPLIVGLASFAVVAAATGFMLVWMLWRPRHHHDAEPPSAP